MQSLYVAALVFRDLVGAMASLAGHNVYAELNGGAYIDPMTRGVTLEVNQASKASSLKTAEGQIMASAPKFMRKQSKAVADASLSNTRNDLRYHGMFAKRNGLDKTVSRVLADAPAGPRMPPHHGNFRSMHAKPEQNAFLRGQKIKRQLDQLRATFAQLPDKQIAPINGENIITTVINKTTPSSPKAKVTSPAPGLAPQKSLSGMKQSPAKRQWALFVDPHLVPTGYAMDG